MQSNWKLGLGFSLLTAVMWGLLPIALKSVLAQMDILTITWYRFSGSALIALIWYGHRSAPALKRLLLGQQRLFGLLAVLGLLGNYLLYLTGLNHITPSAAQIVIQLAPLLLLLGGVAIFKEHFSTPQWLGVGGFTLGMILFFHLRLNNLVSTDGDYLLGILLIICAAICWATYSLAQKQLLASERTDDILLLIYLSGTLCFLPFAQPAQITQLDGPGMALLAFVSLNTIIAYGSFGYAMTHWEVSRVSAAITVAPLFTLLFGQLLGLWRPEHIDTEPLDWLSWSGALMVVTGSIVTALAKSPRPA